MIKYVPGAVAAIASFVILKVVGLFLPNTLWLEIVIFFGAYIVLTVAVERALRRYGTKRR